VSQIITTQFTDVCVCVLQSKGSGEVGEMLAFGIISTLTHWPVQKVFLGLFRGDLYEWVQSKRKTVRDVLCCRVCYIPSLINYTQQRKLAAKQESMKFNKLLSERMDSERSLSSKSDSIRRGTMLGHAESFRIKRRAKSMIEDDLFLDELSTEDRKKLIELRKKRDAATFMRRYVLTQLLKEKEESLRAKLEGPIAAPEWNARVGYVFSIAYVAFMSLYIVLFGIRCV
jgi:hypothetical protein